MPTLLGANTLSTGYDVANSCKFETNTYMTKSASSGNQRTFTVSFWAKRSMENTGHHHYPISFYQDANNRISFAFLSGNSFIIYAESGGSGQLTMQTSALFKDPSAWYHVVIAFDTTQGTDSNRLKLYINGEQITNFADITYPTQNADLTVNTNIYIGIYDTSNNPFHGYLAEFVYIDGLQLDQTSFGEFDSDSPTIWKPIDVSGLTFGTNGFYLDFEDSSNLGNDKNGGTDLTEANIASTDQSTDTCTNNFATKLSNFQTSAVFTEGALVSTHSSNSWQWSPATFAFQNGKWYAEVKVLTVNYSGIGLTDLDDAYGYAPSDTHPGKTAVTPNGRGFFWYYDDGKIYYNNTSMTGPGSFTTNDILMFAIDMTNNKYHFGKNGSWLSSSDPANNTGGFTHQSGGTWTFFDAVGNGGSLSWNYGSPNHSVSSGNSDARGHGNFEYSVPSGFFSLCSKNLAEFG